MPQGKVDGDRATGCSSAGDPVPVPQCPRGGDELTVLWLPSELHASCFVMRQGEEGEQVIQGLQGPGHAQGEGSAWGGRAGLAGRVQPPALSTGAPGKGGSGGRQLQAPRYSHGARMEGAADFAPAFKVWHRD